MRIAVGAPSSGRLRRSKRMLSAFIASPVFTARGTPCSATIVGWLRRSSLPSSTSSCTRKALWSISSAEAEAVALACPPAKGLGCRDA